MPSPAPTSAAMTILWTRSTQTTDSSRGVHDPNVDPDLAQDRHDSLAELDVERSEREIGQDQRNQARRQHAPDDELNKRVGVRPAFSWRGAGYAVDNLFCKRSPRTSDAWSLVIDVSPPLPLEANRAGRVTLRFDDDWLNLADGLGNGRQFLWYDIDLSWNIGDTIEIGIREFPQSFDARSINGWRNNLERPELGMAGTQLLRMAAVELDFAMFGTMDGEYPS